MGQEGTGGTNEWTKHEICKVSSSEARSVGDMSTSHVQHQEEPTCEGTCVDNTTTAGGLTAAEGGGAAAAGVGAAAAACAAVLLSLCAVWLLPSPPASAAAAGEGMAALVSTVPALSALNGR